jgi:TPR repeat protein
MPVLLSAGAIALAGGAWLLWPRSEPPAARSPASPPAALAPAASQLADAHALPASAAVVDVPPSAPKSTPPATRLPPAQPHTSVAASARPKKDADVANTARPPALAPAPTPAPAASVVEAAPPPVITVPAAMAPAPASAPAIDPLVGASDALRRGDNAEADRLARALANKGNARAMEMVGRIAEEGRVTVPNALQAYIWYSLALRHGQSSARPSAERVKGLLQRAEVVQADNFVQNWHRD